MRRLAYSIVAIAALLIVDAIGFDAQQALPPVVIKKHFTSADRVSGRYQYVPFDVPKGAVRLRVSYTYDKANGENIVDLGLFEPGSLDLGTRAFRGYSGGARSTIEITQTGATPGYWEGYIPPGPWHALLGLYRIARAGVDVTLTIEIETSDRLTDVDHVTTTPDAVRGPRWFVGALHAHTLHSDGTVAPQELLAMFGAKGFDFVAITDHNNTTHSQDLKDMRVRGQTRPLWIIGEEVTTPGGHASVWGLPERGWVDFRVLPGDPRIRDLVDAAREQGAMFSINHPASECLACGWTHDVVEGIEGIEISNGRHGEVEKAIALWDKLLVSGRRITGVGSSDWHSAPNPIDNAHVRVQTPALTQENILTGIRAGRVIVMTDARDRTPEFAVRAGGTSVAIGGTLQLGSAGHIDVSVKAPPAAGGHLIVVANGTRGTPVGIDLKGLGRARVPAVPGYVRFELERADGSAMAYTNPVYLVR